MCGLYLENQMKQHLQEIPLNQIHAKENYRKTFRDQSLKELAQSIKKNGVLEPILVRPNNDGFEIIAGERRFRASMMAKLVTIPAVVRETKDEDVLKLQIIENVQREGVQFMEEAYGFKKLRDECAYDVPEIAKMIGKSEAYVYFMLQLTAMTDDARLIAEKGWVAKGVAWQIARLKDPEQQTQAANALARPERTKLITESGAKHYIRDNFGDSSSRLRKRRVKIYGDDQYKSNWKHHLVRFSCDQFEEFKKIVRGRTETDVIAEAVDVVMRGGAAESQFSEVV
jgi:ParB family chromosome partitioning protein